MPKPRKNMKKNTKKRGPDVANASWGNSRAQDSEYRDLRKRVDARKDAKEILKIAKDIENSPDS